MLQQTSINEMSEVEELWDKINLILETETNVFQLKASEVLNINNIYKILEYIYTHYSEPKKLIDFLESTVKLPKPVKKDILEYLLINGFEDTLWYSEISHIDMDETIVQLLSEGFFELYSLVKNKEVKINVNDNAIFDLIERFNEFNLDEKIKFLLSSELDFSLNELFSKEEVIGIKKILKITKDDQILLEKYKNKSLYNLYNEIIYDIKEEINSRKLSIKKELSFVPNYSTTENLKKLDESLLEIDLLNNGTNSFYVTFISVEGKVSTYSLLPFYKGAEHNFNIYFDFNLFKKEILRENQLLQDNLSNNLDYTIIISQKKGSKKPAPINNSSDYEIIDYKMAA